VLGPDRAGQAVLGVVGQRDRVRLVLEREDRDDRAEDLLGHGAVVRGGGQQDRWREPETGAVGGGAPERDIHRSVYIGRHFFAVSGGDQRAHLGLVVGGITDRDARDGRFEQFEEGVEDAALDQDAGAGAAVLARVV